MGPDDFRREYVEPAAELYGQNYLVTHIAANALAQLDALADVVWAAQGHPGGKRGIGAFRDDLGLREPAIAVVRDACDSHKHGRLGRASATHVSGERPTAAIQTGYVISLDGASRSPLHFTVLVIRKLDGAEQAVGNIIYEAMQAWRREFGRLGYGTDWLILGHQF